MEKSIFAKYGKNEEDLKKTILEFLFLLFKETDFGKNTLFEDFTSSFKPFWKTELFIKRVLTSTELPTHLNVEDERLSSKDKLRLIAINLDFIVNSHILTATLKNTWRI